MKFFTLLRGNQKGFWEHKCTERALDRERERENETGS